LVATSFRSELSTSILDINHHPPVSMLVHRFLSSNK
ncbi:hypothetical protein LINPERPRIM_LOCUS5314, partial [Linum perenne]